MTYLAPDWWSWWGSCRWTSEDAETGAFQVLYILEGGGDSGDSDESNELLRSYEITEDNSSRMQLAERYWEHGKWCKCGRRQRTGEEQWPEGYSAVGHYDSDQVEDEIEES